MGEPGDGLQCRHMLSKGILPILSDLEPGPRPAPDLALVDLDIASRSNVAICLDNAESLISTLSAPERTRPVPPRPGRP